MTDKGNSAKQTKNKISTESYKGVRDFYPDDMYIQNYIFSTMAAGVERFGYVEYGASVLEESALYEAKSGEEIVNEQTYTFTDRGDRSVTLRPEMTPSIARMVAKKRRDLAFPLRWYSIPNLFRYERPQRGRLREHWQLNVDLFGIDSSKGDVEIIQVADTIMKTFGATNNQYTIRINSRKLIEHIYRFYSLSDDEQHLLSKLIDRKNKIDDEKFKNDLHDILKDKAELHDIFYRFISNNDFTALSEKLQKSEEKKELDDTLNALRALGVESADIDVSIMRGFDYYTGIVFEVFDTDTQNNRSLFGGGRYDDLLQIFGGERVPAVGFGMGDVTMRDFLETHNLMPEIQSFTDLYICVLDENSYNFALSLSYELRQNGINVELDMTNKKAGDQIKTANKKNVQHLICIGENETQSHTFKLKNLSSGEEVECKGSEGIIENLF